MIRYTSKIGNLKLSEVRGICDMTLAWCVGVFGVNKRRRNPLSIVVEFSHEDRDAFGMYNESLNRIYIYMEHAKTVQDVIQTVIHEYVHSMQPIASKYQKLYRQYKYSSKHPMERQARYYENKYGPLCWTDMKPLL